MKVLHFICSTGFYGAERWILALANNVDRSAVSSELAVTRESESHKLELSNSFSNLGLPVHEIRMRGRFDIGVILKLDKIIKRQGIDIIHTHGYKSDILGVIAARRAGIASVCTPHGFENAKDWKLRFYIWAGCHSFRYFDSVVPLSRQLCADVSTFGVKPEKIRYIPNGVDLKPVQNILKESVHNKLRNRQNNPTHNTDDNIDEYRPLMGENMRSSIGSRNDARPLTIGFIGQLIDRKNVKDVLDTFDTVAERYSGVKLMLLGDGEAGPSLKAYAAMLPSSDRIEFLGFVNDPLKYLVNFDLFVITSSLEGIPRCIMESMAMGVPVAAYNIPGVDQLIKHNESGLLATFGDKQGLQKHWESLLFDDELAMRVAANAQRWVEEKFSAKRMAADYSSLYKALVNGGAE